MDELTVLVVEDEEAFVDALTIGLTREGFTVEVARDGAQALDMFDAIAPDLVLLDLMLPRVSGLALAELIQQHRRSPWRQAPFLALGIHAFLVNGQPFAELGFVPGPCHVALRRIGVVHDAFFRRDRQHHPQGRVQQIVEGFLGILVPGPNLF